MLRIVLSALLSLSVLACTVKPATDYLVEHDFSQYKDFAFVRAPEDAVASIDSSRIESAVVAQLKQKGLRQTDVKSADLLVDYRVDSATELESFGSSLGFGVSRGRGSIAMSTPTRYRERKYGKLVLEFLDPASQSIVWSSISQSQLKETMGPDKRAEFITKQIDLMLSTYPPQPK